MLVLTRNTGESIIIGDDIEVRIFDIKGGHVRIGIEAPDDVTILREELIASEGQGDDGIQCRLSKRKPFSQ